MMKKYLRTKHNIHLDMDVAELILKKSKLMEVEEQQKNMVEYKIDIGDKTYSLFIKAYENQKNAVSICYRGAIFKQKKHVCACDNLVMLFKQIFRRYCKETHKDDFVDDVKISILYRGEEIASDDHSISGEPISLDYFSSSDNAPDDSFEMDQLMGFMLEYYRFIDRMELWMPTSRGSKVLTAN